MANLDELKSIATKNSTWLEEAKKRQENKEWLKHSQKIAIKVLRALREKNIKQIELASLLGVSPQQVNKIVKGRENLTLETITKLETALGLDLLFTENTNVIIKKVHIIKEDIVVWPVYTNKSEIATRTTSYRNNRTEYVPQTETEETCVNYG